MPETEQACARCGRNPEDSLDGIEWEALDETGRMICPDCMAAEEQQVIDEEDLMNLTDREPLGDPDDPRDAEK